MNQFLLLQIELLQEGVVSARVFLGEILHMRLTIGYHSEQTASRVIVFLVNLQVRSQFFDTLGQNSDLYFR